MIIMDKITLYTLTTADIKISIEARFESNNLIIDGYDIGRTVEKYWGDSDYEYTTTISAEGLEKLYKLLGIQTDNKMALLEVLASRFNSNTCYSEIQKMLDDYKIPYEGFSWI
jgi:hypothetical protein